MISKTLKWAEGKYKNALAEMEKYRDLKQQFPFQYNRAFDNVVHWETVMHALELYEKGRE